MLNPYGAIGWKCYRLLCAISRWVNSYGERSELSWREILYIPVRYVLVLSSKLNFDLYGVRDSGLVITVHYMH